MLEGKTDLLKNFNLKLSASYYKVFEPVNYTVRGYGTMIIGGDAEIFMQTGKDGGTYNVGMSRMLPTGNQIVFLSYDPMFVYSKPNSFEYGITEFSPVVQAVYWFERNVSSIKKENTITHYSISQNYPNPFSAAIPTGNPTTTIKYTIPQFPLLGGDGRGGFVTLKIYDILGRETATLVNKQQQPGNYEVQFDADNLTSGIYFYILKVGTFSESKKMIFLK